MSFLLYKFETILLNAMKRHVILLMLTSLSLYIKAQELSPSVFCSAGGVFSNSTQVYWTIGETVVATLANSQNKLSNGFEQPSYIATAVIGNTSLLPLISLFPNPIHDILNIESKNQHLKNLRYEVFDITGNIVKEGNLQNEFTINCSQWLPAVYFIKFLDASNEFIPSYKIIKL